MIDITTTIPAAATVQPSGRARAWERRVAPTCAVTGGEVRLDDATRAHDVFGHVGTTAWSPPT